MGAAVFVLAASACGSKTDAGHVTRAPADLTKGFAEVVVPLPTRQSPMVVAAGDHVVVFGGYRIEGSHEIPRGDGADYDVARGEWTSMPPAPFDRALHLAAGVWTGREVIVVGTPCGTTTTDLYDARCDHATVVAASYTPKTNSWRPLASPDASMFPLLTYGSPLLGVGAGSTGTAVLFDNDTGDASRQYLVADAAGGSWHFLPAFTTADTVCPVAGAVVGVQTGQIYANGGSGSPNPQAVAAPLRTSMLESRSNTWGAPVAIPKPASAGAMFERVVCSAGQLAYFPIFPGPVGIDGGALWYEPGTEQWTTLPSLGATNSPNVVSIAEIHGTKMVVIETGPGSGGSLFLLPAGATSWVRHPLPTTALNSFQALSDLILVVAFDQRGSDHMTIGLLDPTRLPGVAK